MKTSCIILATVGLALAQPQHHAHHHVHRRATTTSSASSSSSTTFTDVLAADSYPDFPDGEIACSAGPPTKYGAIKVDYLGFGGWSGLQSLSSDESTVTASGGSECTDGMSCSYSCAPGWEKLQWLSSQPSNGVSIGGLRCKGGYLYKTNDHAKLCGKGNGLVWVENQASDNVSICRTDYPGTEAETIPLDVSAGDTQPLTCPIEESYYKHMGDYTSAQYYLNPLGVGSNPGCSWDGAGDGETGNWAPIVLGVGQLDGTTWLSIQQNTPTSYVAFTGKVTITGTGISGSCTYENGNFCSASGCTSHTVNGAGCTVSSSSNATFVISA